MHPVIEARDLLESLAGQEIQTATGRANRVLGFSGAGDSVIVATDRSPAGTAVSIHMVQSGLDKLRDAGEVEISVPSLRASKLVCRRCPADPARNAPEPDLAAEDPDG